MTSFLSHANEKVTLQLKWMHQFQFAGYYAAKEKGFYQENGLDVQIKERNLKYNNVEQVINGDAQYGISDSVILLYTAKKQPIKIVAPIFQHSPSVIITLKSSGLDTPYKLKNKKLAFYKKDIDGFDVLAMLKSIDTHPKIERTRGTEEYTLLKDKKVDAYACYLTNEPFHFKEMGVDINIIDPANYGFDLYGDMLFTNVDEAKNHPKRVESFKKATLKGWEYALDHKEEIIQLIQRKYSSNKSIEHLRYEADAIDQMINRNSIPLGTFDKGRIQYTLNLYKQFGLIKNDIPLNEYIFKSFNTPSNLTPEENRYLAQKSTITMCIDPDWMPYEKNSNGKHIGMTADYFKLFEEQLNIPINLVPTKLWTESIEFSKQRKCDIVSLLMPTSSREKYLNFTKPYVKIPLVVATTIEKQFINNIEDIKDKKLGIVKGYAFAEILREKYPNMQLLDVENTNDGLEQVRAGKLYGYIGALTTIGYQIQKKYVSQLKIAGKLNEKWELGIGIRNDEPQLKIIFDKAIDYISIKQHQEILNKRVSVNYAQEVDYTIIFQWLGVLSLFFITILFIILRTNKKLNIEIKNRKKVENEQRNLLSLFDKGDSILFKWSNNTVWSIHYVSNNVSKLLEYEKSEFLDNEIAYSSCIHEDDIQHVKEEVEQAIKYNLDFFKHDPYRIITKSGKVKWVIDYTVTQKDNDGFIEYFIGYITNITNQKKQEDEIREKLQKLIDTQNSIVILIDGNKLKFANKTFLEYFGYKSLDDFKKHYNCICERFVKQDNFFHLGKAEEDTWIESILKLSGRQRIVSMVNHHSEPHAFSVSINDYENDEHIVTFTDISDTMLEKLELKRDATIDELTQLYNRIYFSKNIENILKLHKKHNMRTGIIFFDIDHFKKVNDTYGHTIGDYVLNKLALLVTQSTRDTDKIIRWGGEEFIIIVEINEDQFLHQIAEHLRSVIEKYEFKDVHSITCSFGCSIHDEKNDILATIKKADEKLYIAKDSGRNRVEC
ncbi:MAG: polar amino acid transport system substrate-binding protein [Sulfurimonas sp.]|jgi:polar amino acid transport system substrate-binding protein